MCGVYDVRATGRGFSIARQSRRDTSLLLLLRLLHVYARRNNSGETHIYGIIIIIMPMRRNARPEGDECRRAKTDFGTFGTARR